MSLDFLKLECSTVTSDELFGLCDDYSQPFAYIASTNQNNWIATVNNYQKKTITFTAIDNCIKIYRENGDLESSCDAMMTTDNFLYLVELKNKVSDWKTDGIAQLEATLIFLINSEPKFYNSFIKKKAFVANRRHPHFHVIETNHMERFRDRYKIRLDLQATITIS